MKHKHILYALGVNMIPLIVLNSVAIALQMYGYSTSSFLCGGLVVYGVTLAMGYVMAMQAKKQSVAFNEKINTALQEMLVKARELYPENPHNDINNLSNDTKSVH